MSDDERRERRMASDDAKARVRQALFEGANPRGFSGENATAYGELLAELGPEGLDTIAKAIGNRIT